MWDRFLKWREVAATGELLALLPPAFVDAVGGRESGGERVEGARGGAHERKSALEGLAPTTDRRSLSAWRTVARLRASCASVAGAILQIRHVASAVHLLPWILSLVIVVGCIAATLARANTSYAPCPTKVWGFVRSITTALFLLVLYTTLEVVVWAELFDLPRKPTGHAVRLARELRGSGSRCSSLTSFLGDRASRSSSSHVSRECGSADQLNTSMVSCTLGRAPATASRPLTPSPVRC